MTFRQLAAVLALALPAGAGGVTLAPTIPAVHANPPSARDAPIALLADLSSGQVLAAREADRRFLPASMTKVMTALVVFDRIKAGQLDEAALVTISPGIAARWAGKGTTLNLRAGEQVRLTDLIRGTTTVSGNDAAFALAEAAAGSVDRFVALMNARAQSIGMTGSHFGNPSGLPDRGQTYVTANDLVRLASVLMTEHPALYGRYFGKKTMMWRGAPLRSHDPFAGVLPGADGIKTGHTREAGFNFLGAVERGGRRLVLVIGGAPTEPARAAAAAALAEWGYAAWSSTPFLPAGGVVGAVAVQDGAARQVAVAVPRAFSLAVRKGYAPALSGVIRYTGPVRAPIVRGQAIGRLDLRDSQGRSHSLPLVAAEPVARAGPIDRIVNALLGLVA